CSEYYVVWCSGRYRPHITSQTAHNSSVRHVELVVIGGGPAGIAAARAAAKRGMQTVLVDENPIEPGNISRNVPLWYGSRAAGRAKAADLFGWLGTHPKLEQAVD